MTEKRGRKGKVALLFQTGMTVLFCVREKMLESLRCTGLSTASKALKTVTNVLRGNRIIFKLDQTFTQQSCNISFAVHPTFYRILTNIRSTFVELILLWASSKKLLDEEMIVRVLTPCLGQLATPETQFEKTEH